MTDFSEPTTATGSTWIRCFSPDGYQMALTLPITSVADALRHLADIRAAGLTATLPGLKTGELSGTITSCMKREKQNRDGSITPIIDMYGPWEGEFGRYRFVGVYLNTPEDVAEFEANSGLKIKNMPLFDSQVPLQRTAGITHKCEVKCQPFEVVKKEDAMKEIGGEMKMTYELARYVSTSATPPAPKAADPFAGTAFDDANPYENPATQAAITATIKKHGLDQNGGVAFLMRWAHPDPERNITRISDFHPGLTPDQLIAAIPSLAGRYRDEKAKEQKGASVNEVAAPLAGGQRRH
jgi:hypothetical protein